MQVTIVFFHSNQTQQAQTTHEPTAKHGKTRATRRLVLLRQLFKSITWRNKVNCRRRCTFGTQLKSTLNSKFVSTSVFCLEKLSGGLLRRWAPNSFSAYCRNFYHRCCCWLHYSPSDNSHTKKATQLLSSFRRAYTACSLLHL